MKNYAEEYLAKLNRQEWRLRRLEILERDGFTCRSCHQAGGSLEIHHLRYLAGKEPWDYPDDLLVTLCRPCHEATTVAQLQERGDVRSSLKFMAILIGRRMTWPEKEIKSEGPIFKASTIDRWMRRRIPDGPLRRQIFRFAGWLFKTGTTDMGELVALLDEAIRKNPDCWYAYFAPGGPARTCRHDQRAIQEAEAQQREYQRQDRQFLSDGFGHGIASSPSRLAGSVASGDPKDRRPVHEVGNLELGEF